MAKPKVFISSTCYDFREVRDSLSSFVRSFGFEPVLSEHGDVFYHPDLHTHEACNHEVSNCQLFILLIGGRFGGEYVYDKDKSITNAEYEAAVLKKIPVFTYIKRSVLDNHHTYQTNKDKSFVKEMHFPAIENQSDSSSIFEFINRVRRAPVNNSYEAFETSRDIESHLKKQWAGMFFDFLKNREMTDKIANTNDAVHEIRSAGEKLEELIKNVYRVVDKDNADKNINDIEINVMAKEYLERVISGALDGSLPVEGEKEKSRILSVDPTNFNWYEYLVEIGFLYIEDEDDEKVDLTINPNIESIIEEYNGFCGITINKTPPLKYQDETHHLYENGFKILTKEQRDALISTYLVIINSSNN